MTTIFEFFFPTQSINFLIFIVKVIKKKTISLEYCREFVNFEFQEKKILHLQLQCPRWIKRCFVDFTRVTVVDHICTHWVMLTQYTFKVSYIVMRIIDIFVCEIWKMKYLFSIYFGFFFSFFSHAWKFSSLCACKIGGCFCYNIFYSSFFPFSNYLLLF